MASPAPRRDAAGTLPPDPAIENTARFARLPGLAGFAMVVVAAIVLLGWWLGVPALTRLMTGATSMKAASALAFVAAGSALMACARRRPRTVRCQLANLAVLLMGVASIVQYAAGVDLGIDHLFPDPEALAMDRPPGRMSQTTALGFVLLGAQGLLVSRQIAPRTAHLLAGCLLSLGALALAMAGYTYQVGHLRLLPMAAPTAVLLIVGTLGWLLLQRPIGIMRVAFADTPGGVLLRRLALPALFLPTVAAIAARASERWLAWTHGEIVTVMAYLNGVGASAMVIGMAWLLHNLDRHRRTSERFHDAAYSDALTGLVNRRGFDEAIERLLQGHRQSDDGFTMLMLDLDHFKQFNDDFGHLAGDEALQSAAALMRAALRPQDIAARFGGEEFAVLLPGTPPAGARRAAERLRAAFHAFPWPHRAVTASIGIAASRPGDTPTALVARVDAALYAAKAAGRDCAREEDGAAP